MMFRTSMMAGALASAAFAMPAPAHHSAAEFDFATTAHMAGVVTAIEVANPHTRLTLQVKDARGSHVVDFEGHSRNNMYRGGWRPDMINVGDSVTVNYAPRRNGKEGGYAASLTLASGKTVGLVSN